MAEIEVDENAGLLHGRVLHIRDMVTFEAETIGDLKIAFKDSVEDYLDFCRKRGEKPEKPFSGRILLRLSPEDHARVAQAAEGQGMSANAWLVRQVKVGLSRARVSI